MRIALCATMLLLLSDRCGDEIPLNRRIIIFQDITASLKTDETDEGSKIVNAIIDRAKPGTSVTVIPICENTELAPGVSWVVPQPNGFGADRQNAVLKDRAARKQQVAQNTALVRAQKRAVHSLHASCVSPGLYRARSLSRNRDPKKRYLTEVVFVSDMIEECQTSLLGQPIRLIRNVDKEFDRAKALAAPNDPLMTDPGFKVIVILPHSQSTSELTDEYPVPRDLEDFWKRIFTRAGLQEGSIWWDADREQYIASIE